MALKDDLTAYCKGVFRDQWTTRNGLVVPSDTSLTLSNDGIELDATVLYADLADSTIMVDTKSPSFAAEVYKTFLYCAAKVIRSHQGEITAYDGDRIMAVFIGGSKNTQACKAALQINWVTKNIVQTEMSKIYTSTDFKVKHVVGIDTSKLLVSKVGIRGSNDLVWVGRAANHAAKLSARHHDVPTYISADVYNNIGDSAKLAGTVDIWTPYSWDEFDGRTIYGTTFWRNMG